MKKNNKGQALVEFVLIIPVLLFVILAGFDFSRVIYEKTRLENILNDMIQVIDKDEEYISNYLNKKDKLVHISITNDGEYKKIELNKNIKIFTPGLNSIIGSPYKIKTERLIENE